MEQMRFLFTARETFSKISYEDGKSWNDYIKWRKLTHLTELVSLDLTLAKILVEPDYDNSDDWNFIYIFGLYQTGLFTSLDYVLRRLKAKDKFNLLTAVIEPNKHCNNIVVKDYEFMGYELLDQEFGTSALTNCSNFEKIISPTDLNNKGLVIDYAKAYDIKKRLFETYPEEHHTHINVIAIWRHKTIGT